MEDIKSESLQEEGVSLLGDEGSPTSLNQELGNRHDSRGSKRNSLLIVLLAISVVANILLLLPRRQSLGLIHRSKYAGLVNDFELPYAWDSDRSNPNDTERNKLWYEDEEADQGIMAVDNDEAISFGLPNSQPWSWDAKVKSIYITNGHHNLHCLRNIYISIDEHERGVPQSLGRHHILHCLGALYDDIKCNADDTPRYTDKHGRKPGEGQIRKCRDWSKLKAFVNEREGCFKYIKHDKEDIRIIERMKYCSNNSPYLPKIRKYFGFSSDWTPWPYVEQDTYLTKEHPS
ncbi:Uncharacterized protein BP5553_06708 [Venustampulla echinocandica]|uniref:Uncharacterized protein n=1 Tax=Venustampulla echinocandica TaxID=2656787 RepID=A0A370TKN4_9HELO|nr:Uncharacterized protein BP5553_06708 [Venustampulla echinocandica]RDL36096.1 Uncharacterized protein BP5553_06708 [Venustampulla echinocandica]